MATRGSAVRVHNAEANHCKLWVGVECLKGVRKNIVMEYAIVVEEAHEPTARRYGPEVAAPWDAGVRPGSYDDVGKRVIDLGFAVVHDQDDLYRCTALTPRRGNRLGQRARAIAPR